MEMIKDLLEISISPGVDVKVIKETCTRIGIANKIKKILYPSCYLFTEEEKHYLVHFKQMFLLTRESAYNALCEDDILRRNAIAFCLRQWGLIEVDDEKIMPHNKYVFVLPYNQKQDWQISHKFNFKTINNKEGDILNA
jgi:hypothetical protein